MKLAFNREFTEGYFSGCHNYQKLTSSERPMGRGIFLGFIEKNNLIKLEEDLSVGDGVGIWLKDKVDGAVIRKIEKDGKSVKESKRDDLVRLYIRAPLGTKIYKTSSRKELKDPVKFNFTKNQPLKDKRRIVKELILPSFKKFHLKNENFDKPKLLVKVYSQKEGKEALKAGADIVFYNIFSEDFDNDFSAYVPILINDENVEKAAIIIKTKKIKDVLIGNIGAYCLLKEQIKNRQLENINLYLDYTNNIFNDFDLNLFEDCTTIISPELSFNELQQFKNKNFAILVHSRVVLMNTKYNLLPKQLCDQKKYTFPVRKEHSYYQVLNSVELGLFEEAVKLKKFGINYFFLDLDKNVSKNVKIYNRLLSGENINIKKKGYTKGNYKEGVK